MLIQMELNVMQDQTDSTAGSNQPLKQYPLLEALLHRRSRRFGQGMHLNGGPLAYASARPPQPLSLEEEAALAFAGGGITGYALAELPYQSGEMPGAGGGNIMTRFIGRTIASGDAMHAASLFIINDDGAWMLKRPQDFPRADVAELIQTAREYKLLELYQKSRVRIANRRPEIPRKVPFTPAFNIWSANQPGTTYFLPVNELTGYAINILLTVFEADFGYFLVDERNRFRPAGIAKFARSRGGHLHDDPAAGRLGTVGVLETWVYEFAAIEQGAMLQNLALMTQALGLGGFPHFAAHPFVWFQALGFRMAELPFSRTIGAGRLMRSLLKTMGRDIPVPTAVGLERESEVLVKPFCPPYYGSMEEAVLAFVDSKYAQDTGTFRDGGAVTGWKDGAAVQAGIPRYSDQAIAATIAYCEYVYNRYGRFPANSGPFRTILAHQAHHLDLDFYAEFYRPEVVSDTQRQHTTRWHNDMLDV
jgi:hypothetical protein